MHYLFVFLKGIAMGAADVVPGVSGGTIAFITGIYDRLLASINAINFGLIKIIKTQGIAAAWKKINGNFLLSLFAGILVSVFSLAKVLEYLNKNHPILLWAFFFGLIIASIVYVGKQVKKWNVNAIIGLIAGTILVFGISLLPPLGDSTNLGFIFICGVIAICAMILPGVSGSFLLLVLGAYHSILGAVNDKNFVLLGVFMAGALIGLLSFSRVLKWVLDKYRSVTIATLTGFLVGSLWEVWPWKITTQYRINSHGEEVPFIQDNIAPNEYIWQAALIAIAGFSLIFIIELVAKKLTPNAK